MSLGYPIKIAAQRSGVSAHAIRAWEKRYQVVSPNRSGTNRRRYTDADIERLRLLQLATQSGHSIGNIAGLSAGELHRLIGDEAARRQAAGLVDGTDFKPPSGVAEALEATRRFDAARIEACLQKAALEMGAQGMLHHLVVPLIQALGDGWERGELTVAHEHFTSAKIRSFLGESIRPFAGMDGAPVLVVATPSGQLHDLGAVLVSTAAGQRGWRVVYLGASLPAVEISGAALQNRAAAVALSLVFPEDDLSLPAQLTQLRRSLPPETALLVGGRAASAYQPVLRDLGAQVSNSLAEFCRQLDGVRRLRPGAINASSAARRPLEA